MLAVSLELAAGKWKIALHDGRREKPAVHTVAQSIESCIDLCYRPFDDSVCGVTLAMGKPELFKTPQRYFPSIEALSPPVVEALLCPSRSATARGVPSG